MFSFINHYEKDKIYRNDVNIKPHEVMAWAADQIENES